MNLSKSAYARHRGISPAAISNFIARGKLTPPAVCPDGKIDPLLADAQLGAMVDPVMSASARNRAPRPQPAAAATRVSTADMLASSQLLKARAMSATVAAERSRRELNLERGKYLLAETATVAWGKALAEFLQGVELSFPDLAVSLGLDREKKTVLRKWWRETRSTLAAEARARADAAPEFDEDPDPRR